MWALRWTCPYAPVRERLSPHECMWPRTLGGGPHAPPIVASGRMGDKQTISHRILFCCSVLLILLQSQGVNNASFQLRFKLFSMFPSLGPYCLRFGFWPCIYVWPISRLSAEKNQHLFGTFCMPLTLSAAERTKQTPPLHQDPGAMLCCHWSTRWANVSVSLGATLSFTVSEGSAEVDLLVPSLASRL